jgi:dienelactone hydrolase
VDLLHYYDLAAGVATPVPLDWENGLTRGFAVTPAGLVASLANGARPRAAVYTRTAAGFSRAWIEGEHAAHLFAFEVSDDGKTALYLHTTASSPGQWYAARLEGNTLVDAKPFAKVNAGLKDKPIARTELVYWKGARDEQVEGILYYPHHYQAGKKYPLVPMIHGGPHGASYDSFQERWAEPANLLAARGAFVLKPNYHGSSDYGLKWGESISAGNYNELEWIDVEKGVDSLIAKGLVDPGKLGVMGWSNGSIISIELTTRTTRYKAASAGAGAGDVNWISDWGNCQFGHSFDDYYIDKSPLFRMDKVRTPTIIFFGTIDRQVPTEQGWQHFRALQHYGKTDVRFILFPGEAHSPRKLEEELAWFDKYLFATAKPAEEWLKPESPLAAAVKLKAAGQAPETVERGKLNIGRFEVTRAQYAAFDPNYKYPAGAGQHPAGAKYRLGTEEEMEKFLKAAKGENTLDAWAGYTVNADDAGRLAPLVDGLGPGALLKPVERAAPTARPMLNPRPRPAPIEGRSTQSPISGSEIGD